MEQCFISVDAQVFQGHEKYCHDLEVTGLNPRWVELGVRSLSKSDLNQKI